LTHHLSLPETNHKKELYKALLPQIESLFKGEMDMIANMANLTAVLRDAFQYLWIGFYLVKGNELVLGPFQGPLACTRIAFGKGVCGKSWEKKEILIVPDVDQFPGHIACSSESRSEIVIPGILEGKVKFVLDVDSRRLNEFDETDAHYLHLMIDRLLQYSDS
jgi:GAF domain-containing protein